MTTPNAYQQLGLTTPDANRVPRRLVVSLAGLEKTGKTHFALTGRPPIVIFNLDVGTEGVVEKFVAQGKEVYVHNIPLSRPAGMLKNAAASEEVSDSWRSKWVDLSVKLEQVYALNPGTVVVDTWTEAHELARLAHFGKLSQVQPHNYGPVNDDMAALVRQAYRAEQTTTVFLQKMRTKFGTNPPELEVHGWSQMDYMVQVNLRNGKSPNQSGQGIDTYFSQIKDCRQNPHVVGYGLSGDAFSLEYLENLVLDWRP